MPDKNLSAKKGDILTVRNEDKTSLKPLHYIIYLDQHPTDKDVFIGAMLTHSTINENIPLQQDHFITSDNNGNAYKVTFDRSLVANHPLYKKITDHPLEKVGQLSQKGISFIENNIAPYKVQFLPDKLK